MRLVFGIVIDGNSSPSLPHSRTSSVKALTRSKEPSAIQLEDHPTLDNSEQCISCELVNTGSASISSADKSSAGFIKALPSTRRFAQIGKEKRPPRAPLLHIYASVPHREQGRLRAHAKKEDEARTLISQTAICKMASRRFVSATMS